jgi:PAT family beta-lactamase induction signal transducer AmpG
MCWVLTQLVLIVGIASLGFVDGSQVGVMIVGIAVAATFLSATHDISADAYRADLLRPN